MRRVGSHVTAAGNGCEHAAVSCFPVVCIWLHTFRGRRSSVCSTSEKILTVFLLSEDLRPRNIAGGDTRSSDGRGGGSGDGGAGIDTVGSGTGPGPGSAFTAAPSFWDAHLDVLPGLQTYETMAYVWRPEELRELHHSSFAADMEAPLPALRRSYAEFKAAVDVSLRASRLVDKASPASAPGYVASLERLSRVTFTHVSRRSPQSATRGHALV